MFDAVSWDEFLLIAVLVITGYYVFISMLFYRQEIILSVKIPNKSNPISERSYMDETDTGNDFLGKARPDIPLLSDHITSTDSEQMQFPAPEEAAHNPDKQHIKKQDALLIGAVADLLEETKTLVQVIVDCEGDKGESVSMFQSLLAKYPQIANTKFRALINMYIMDECKQQCEFELAIGEIDSWWPKF